MKQYIQTKAIAKNSFSDGNVPYTNIYFDTNILDCTVDESIFTNANNTVLHMTKELQEKIMQRGALNEDGTKWEDATINIIVDSYQYLEVTLIEGTSPETYQTTEGLKFQKVVNDDDLEQMKIIGIQPTSTYITVPPYIMYNHIIYKVASIENDALTNNVLKGVLFYETNEPIDIILKESFINTSLEEVYIFCTYNETKEKIESMINSSNIITSTVQEIKDKVTYLEQNMILENTDATFKSLEITEGNIYLENSNSKIKIKKSS